jgi:hypothetical protein
VLTLGIERKSVTLEEEEEEEEEEARERPEEILEPPTTRRTLPGTRTTPPAWREFPQFSFDVPPPDAKRLNAVQTKTPASSIDTASFAKTSPPLERAQRLDLGFRQSVGSRRRP